MRIHVRLLLTVSLVCPMVMAVERHSFEEQHQLVSLALHRALSVVTDNLPSGPFHEPLTDTWEGFLGSPTEEWTLADRKEAFCAYLAHLGASNMVEMDGMDRVLARAALSQCEILACTNAVPALKAIGLNQNGLYREDAIELAVTFSPLDTNLVAFVENVMTNTVAFTLRERASGCAILAKKILDEGSITNAVPCSASSLAVAMLYRNRYSGTAGAIMLDKVFCAGYEGYEVSSNRLNYANFILNHPNCRAYNCRDFSSITNELLSSGQPLRQLNIGENAE